MFADDLTLRASGANVREIENKLRPALNNLHDWAHWAGLSIAQHKCSSTFFSINPAEIDTTANVSIDGVQLPNEPTPCFLGVTFDRTLSFTPHVESLVDKVQGKLQAMRALTGRSWGQGESTLRVVYNATVESTLAYASGTYTTFAKPTTLAVVNRTINQGARIITGLHASAPTGPLLFEAGLNTIGHIGQVRAATQMERAARLPSHPLHSLASDARTRRRIKRSCLTDAATATISACKLARLEKEPLHLQRPPEDIPDVNTSDVTFHTASAPKHLAESERL
jgi:hypothetical protein